MNFFDNLTIKQKLAMAFGVIVLIIMGVIAASMTSFARVSEINERKAEAFEVIVSVERLRRSIINMETGLRGFSLTGDDVNLEPYVQGQEQFERATGELKSAFSGNEEMLARIDNMQEQLLSWEESTVVPQMEIRDEINNGLDIMQSMEGFVRRGTGREAMGQMRAIGDEIIEIEREVLAGLDAEQRAAEKQAQIVLLASGGVAVVLAVLMALFISNNIARRLREAVSVAEATAAGDLTVAIESRGRDEIADLSRAMANMQTSLRDLLGRIASGSEQLAGAATQLGATADSLEEASSQQSESSSSMAAAVEELTVSISQVSDGASEASSIAHESGRVSEEGAEVLERTVASIRQIADKVTVTSKDIEALDARSGEISTIINVIKEIAEQTNLLALNAAIEAARAGEQGRGFAVVADEVRKLAERTSVSTQEISDMIGQIQEGTGRAVTAMRSSIQQVDEGVELAGQAGDVIGRIAEGAREVVRHAQSISDALKEQSVASNDVSGNVERIAQMAEENNGSVRETVQTAKSLGELGKELKAAVSRFRLA